MKTTFSYFPGMFENPTPAKIIFKKIKNIIIIISFFANTPIKYNYPKLENNKWSTKWFGKERKQF